MSADDPTPLTFFLYGLSIISALGCGFFACFVLFALGQYIEKRLGVSDQCPKKRNHL